MIKIPYKWQIYPKMRWQNLPKIGKIARVHFQDQSLDSFVPFLNFWPLKILFSVNFKCNKENLRQGKSYKIVVKVILCVLQMELGSPLVFSLKGLQRPHHQVTTPLKRFWMEPHVKMNLRDKPHYRDFKDAPAFENCPHPSFYLHEAFLYNYWSWKFSGQKSIKYHFCCKLESWFLVSMLGL